MARRKWRGTFQVLKTRMKTFIFNFSFYLSAFGCVWQFVAVCGLPLVGASEGYPLVVALGLLVVVAFVGERGL